MYDTIILMIPPLPAHTSQPKTSVKWFHFLQSPNNLSTNTSSTFTSDLAVVTITVRSSTRYLHPTIVQSVVRSLGRLFTFITFVCVSLRFPLPLDKGSPRGPLKLV